MEKERDMDIEAGGCIGGYQLLELLGTGATARVYRVKRTTDGMIAALKYGSNAGLIRREAGILRQLSYPCFPRWIDQGEEKTGAYLVMEYIPGISLQQLMKRYPGGMPEQMAAGIGLEIAQGLACLHGCQPAYVYRDLKAANVIVTPQGRARLVDLGAAVCPEQSEAHFGPAGTYGYGAPEQFWNGAGITPACDVYGLGKLLAFLLTGQDPGRPPYDTAAYCSRHAGVSRAFARLLNRCLQQDPQLRYPDGSFLLPQLTRLKSGKRLSGEKICRRTGGKKRYRYIKCIWRSEYKRLF